MAPVPPLGMKDFRLNNAYVGAALLAVCLAFVVVRSVLASLSSEPPPLAPDIGLTAVESRATLGVEPRLQLVSRWQRGWTAKASQRSGAKTAAHRVKPTGGAARLKHPRDADSKRAASEVHVAPVAPAIAASPPQSLPKPSPDPPKGDAKLTPPVRPQRSDGSGIASARDGSEEFAPY
jgi:hypothetical protein